MGKHNDIQKEIRLLDRQIKAQTKRMDNIAAKRGTIMGIFTAKKDQAAKDQLAEQIAHLKDEKRRMEKFQNLDVTLNLFGGLPKSPGTKAREEKEKQFKNRIFETGGM